MRIYVILVIYLRDSYTLASHSETSQRHFDSLAEESKNKSNSNNFIEKYVISVFLWYLVRFGLKSERF